MDTGFPTVAWRLCLGLGCALARVSAAPRHSWLGRWGVCVFACALRLYPAIPGRGLRCGCVCLGSGFGCAPPLLTGVLGPFCACVPAPVVPHHSWLGCAAWLCVLGLGFRLRPATPGWGVGVCVCLCVRSACTPPLLAGLCGVGLCVWAWVLAVPRHSWLGCWGVCVLVCALRLYPATPGWGVRCGCVCLGWNFGCAPPLLAEVLGCACLCARSACTLPLLAGSCGGGLCAWARVSAASRHSWLACWGVCVRVCALRLYPAPPGWGVQSGCACLSSCFRCAPPLLAGMLGCACLFARSACTLPLFAGVSGVGVCAWALVSASPRHSWLACWGVRVCVHSPLVPHHSWLGCADGVCAWAQVSAAAHHSRLGCSGVCVFVYALRLYPATPGLGVRHGCVCLGLDFGCAPPPLAGVLGCVCVRPPAPLVPRHSWLGSAAWVCVLGLGFPLRPATVGWGVGLCVFVCALRLYPATPGWGVRCGCVYSGSGFGCAPPVLALVLGCVCAFVRAPLVPRHSWLQCAVWKCVFGLGFWLRPATPGWGGCVYVCLCARSACTAPLLAGVCGVGVCVWAWVSAALRPSWLGCQGVRVCVHPPLVPRHSSLGCALWLCVLGLGFRLCPAFPGSGVGVCVFVCALRLYSASPGWVVQRRRVSLGLGLGCAPQLLAGVFGCVCVRVPAQPVPRLSWLGCAAWVCVIGLGFWLRPATPGLGVGVCVFVCALRLYPATPGRGFWCVAWALPGTCACAVVRCVLCALPGFAAPDGRCCLAPVRVPWLWPAASLSGVPLGPALVRRASSGPVALGAPVGFLDAVVPFPILGACAPGFTGRLRGARGGQPTTGLIVPAAGPRRGRGSGLAPRRTRSGLAMGLSLAGPSGVLLGLRALRWLSCVDPVTDASGFLTYDFSSCFFRKFKKSTKRSFSQEMTYSFGFYIRKNRRGGPPTQTVSKNIKNHEMRPVFLVFLPALGWSCRTVLHTSVPAYRGFSTEIPIFFAFSAPKIGMGGFLPPKPSPKPSENPGIRPILEYFCLLPGGAAEQCCTPVYLYSIV